MARDRNGAADTAGVTERVSPHTPKHSFATHLPAQKTESASISPGVPSGMRSIRGVRLHPRLASSMTGKRSVTLEALSCPQCGAALPPAGGYLIWQYCGISVLVSLQGRAPKRGSEPGLFRGTKLAPFTVRDADRLE